MAMRIMRTILLCFLLSVVFVMAAITCPAFAEPEPKVCGEYTYIPPDGYKSTEIIYDEPKGSVFINKVPWVRTADDLKGSSVNCILIRNSGDYSYKFEAQREIRYRTSAKQDGFLSTAGQCSGDFEKYKAHLLSRKGITPMREGRLAYRVAIEINEEGNEFDTIFAINLSKYDHNQTNEQIAEEMCALAKRFITTIKKR